jgi:hypothetical protein
MCGIGRRFPPLSKSLEQNAPGAEYIVRMGVQQHHNVVNIVIGWGTKHGSSSAE